MQVRIPDNRRLMSKKKTAAEIQLEKDIKEAVKVINKSGHAQIDGGCILSYTTKADWPEEYADTLKFLEANKFRAQWATWTSVQTQTSVEKYQAEFKQTMVRVKSRFSLILSRTLEEGDVFSLHKKAMGKGDIRKVVSVGAQVIYNSKVGAKFLKAEQKMNHREVIYLRHIEPA